MRRLSYRRWALLILLCGGWVAVFFSDSILEKTVPYPSVSPSFDSIDSAFSTTSSDVIPIDSVQGSLIVQDTVILPPDVRTMALSVGSNDEGERIVVPSLMLEAALEDKHPEMIKTRTVDTVESELQQTSNSDSDLLVKASNLMGLQHALAGIPLSHYTLQLATLSSQQALSAFLKQGGDVQNSMVYATFSQGKQTFIVISGNYESKQAAVAAQLALPEQLKQNKPWIKSYAQIQQEIALTKKTPEKV